MVVSTLVGIVISMTGRLAGMPSTQKHSKHDKNEREKISIEAMISVSEKEYRMRKMKTIN